MRVRIWNLMFSLSLVMATTALAKEPAGKSYFQVDIHHIDTPELDAVKTRPDVSWWIEAGDVLLVLAEPTFSLPHRATYRLEIAPRSEKLFFVQKGHSHQLAGIDADVLTKAGRMALLQSRGPRPPYGISGDARILAFQPNTVFAKQARPLPKQSILKPNPSIKTMVDALNGERWHKDVETLASFNRYSYGADLARARDWLMAAFAENAGVTVTSQAYKKSNLESWNVVATLTGTERPDDVYVFGAHYDATSESPKHAAPGAEDNASGAAGLLELARVFSAHPPKATIVFVAFSGEEQGLWGSQAYVRSLIAAKEHDKIKAVITMDMIGFDGNDTLDCLVETSAANKNLVEALQVAATTYTSLEFTSSEHYWGSDHVPFIDKGIPAVLTIEDDWDEYPDYHRTTDKIENVKVEMGLEVLKMNLATIAAWSN